MLDVYLVVRSGFRDQGARELEESKRFAKLSHIYTGVMLRTARLTSTQGHEPGSPTELLTACSSGMVDV